MRIVIEIQIPGNRIHIVGLQIEYKANVQSKIKICIITK